MATSFRPDGESSGPYHAHQAVHPARCAPRRTADGSATSRLDSPYRFLYSTACSAEETSISQAQLAQTREQVSNDVETAKADLSRARGQYTAQQQNVAEAEEAYKLASL